MTNVFQSRNFRLVFFGALVSEIGALLYSFAVGFYILEITDNNAFLQGLYLALCGAVFLIVTPIGGVLGDRFHKGKIMFVCDYIKGGLILAATLAMFIFKENSAHVVILFAVGILGNAVSGVFSPASGSLFPHIIEEEQLQQANSYFSVKNALQSILGVVLAGVLYASIPILVLFVIVGICYVLSGISEMFIRYDHHRSEEKLTVKLALSDMRDGLVYVKSQKPIMVLLVAILFINFFFTPISSNFIPYFVKTDVAGAPSYLFDSFLTPELYSSVLSMMFGISTLVCSIILSAKKQEDKCGKKIARFLTVTAATLIMVTVGYYIFVERGVSLNAFLILLCGGCLLIGTFITFVNIPLNTTLMRITDKDKLSKVTSIIGIIAQGMIPIASVLAGTVLQYLGSSALLLASSVGFTAASLFLLFNKETKKF
ncbi:MAG: MFS transporter [Clostridia bacterium]|nr:MFS transporter [Clostridia bacterium]